MEEGATRAEALPEHLMRKRIKKPPGLICYQSDKTHEAEADASSLERGTGKSEHEDGTVPGLSALSALL
jgi:hypothetical protein